MFTKHHPLKKVIESQLRTLKTKSLVLDIGTSKRFAKEIEFFRPILTKHNYFALGYNPETHHGRENCDLNGDILALPLKDNCTDLSLCIEVIEHVANPQLAINELYRTLKPGGILILTTPFLNPYHGKSSSLNDFSHTGYPDFWRFTFQGLEYLCREFNEVQVYPFSNTWEYYLYHVAQWHKIPILNSQVIQKLISDLQQPIKGCATSRHLVIAQK